MNGKVVMVVFVSVFLLYGEVGSQTVKTEQPLALTINKTPVPHSIKKKEMGEIAKEAEPNYVITNIKIPPTKSVDEVRVEYFFDNTSSSCADKVCFGMIPIPGVYYQSENKKKQFIGATTGSRTELFFRFKF